LVVGGIELVIFASGVIKALAGIMRCEVEDLLIFRFELPK
jgi:hypothetical protein